MGVDIWFLIGSEFSRAEPWGDSRKMSGVLLLVLRALRQAVGKPFVIHCGYELTGHTSDSKHHTGEAVDFHVADMPYVNAVLAIQAATVALQVDGFIGLGIYPEWEHPGFHLDIRPNRARWGRVGGKYVSYENALDAIKTDTNG